MYDPTHENKKEISNEEKDEEFEKEHEVDSLEDHESLHDFEKDKIKYGQEVKFIT